MNSYMKREELYSRQNAVSAVILLQMVGMIAIAVAIGPEPAFQFGRLSVYADVIAIMMLVINDE